MHLKRRDSIDDPKNSVEGPGYAHLNSHQPSVFLSDTLILDTMLYYSQDTIYFKDVDSRFILNNRAHALQFGKNDPGELIGKSDADFYPREQADMYRQEELQIMQTGAPLIDRVEQAVNANGEAVMYSSRKYPLYDQNGKIVGTWGFSRDITTLVKAEEETAQVNAKLTALALIDDLSGLYNQRHFHKMLKVAIDLFTRKRLRGLKANFCLLYLDVDWFKQINDTYGHVAGDAVIRYIGGQLTAHTRSSDTAFRYGGDEFAMILQDTDLPTGRGLCERLRSFIEQNPLDMDGTEIPLTVSLGIIDYHNEKTTGELVKRADIKLYQAKSEGKNCLRG
jgi:diguanylate cyclase (GGDEF)-like protein/PAS domain S-box-containing protein